jgi:hypothetical protein
MRKLFLISFICLVLVWEAHAQFQNSEQERHWFFLQTLADQIGEHIACAALRKDDEKFWNRYYNLADRIARETEDYVATYANTRSAQESIPAFRHRVWEVVLRKQQESENTIHKSPPDKCILVLSRP